ncbi:hypothetical protein FGO68_gene16408 [Halteria grandinella]|uniref:Uncharacterized protein n=1 Tax=Halteria grandinella TaxID=5974 RepID=A0A8J8NRH2_HALGN|nr:hypothetical protein FGO68_gene16408 [Halteria grandinella]
MNFNPKLGIDQEQISSQLSVSASIRFQLSQRQINYTQERSISTPLANSYASRASLNSRFKRSLKYLSERNLKLLNPKKSASALLK